MKLKSNFFIPTVLVTSAMAMSYFQFKNDQRYIDLSAFKNLAYNAQAISSYERLDSTAENNLTTASIINTIDKELSKKISNFKQPIKIGNIKRHYDLPKTHIAELAPEINNKELIKLHEIKTEKKIFLKLESLVADEVKITAAAPAAPEASGPIEPVAADETKQSDNDMPMFEYSEVKPEKKIEKLFDRSLSHTVQEAISREVGAIPTRFDEKVAKKQEAETIPDNNDQIIYNYTKAKPKKQKAEGFTTEIVNQKLFQISAFQMELAKESDKQINSFNFTPDYNREERIDSGPSGIAQLNWALTEGLNTQTGIVEASGMMPTRVEVNLSTHDKMRVPMISQEEAENLYPGKNLLLLALDSNILETDIDNSFSEKIFLDDSFKKTEERKDARFVLYTGIKNGNILLKYYLSNKETAQKVIYIGENEMYFEEPSFIDSERLLYSFNTRNLMSTKSTALSISPEFVSVFNTNITAKKRTLNSYELKMPSMIAGSRQYVELKHLSDSIFVGTDTKFDIEIPSNDFIAKVLEINEVSSLKEHCVVQVNITKDLEGFVVNGKNHQGEMYTETSFIDEDGNFSKSDIELAQKVFVVGDMEGIFNAKLEYSDGSTQFLKTYCSQGTYIVEQL